VRIASFGLIKNLKRPSDYEKDKVTTSITNHHPQAAGSDIWNFSLVSFVIVNSKGQ
jgi:hypothetical protein